MANFAPMLLGKPYLKRALLFAFGLKLFYLLLGNLLPNGWNGIEHVLDVFARNDSAWYSQISRVGYPTFPPSELQQTPFAFFPLYPAIIALFRQPISWFIQDADLVYIAASFTAHIVFTWLWVALLFRWLETTGMELRRIFIYSIFFQLFPFHFFYHMFYSEVLFSILYMWAMVAVFSNRHASLAFSVAFLTLCRPTGIVFSAGLGLLILADNGWIKIWKEKEKIKQILALLASPAALLLWMVYLHFHCGDAMAFSSAQASWGRQYVWPWESLFASGHWYVQLVSAYVLILFILALWLFRRMSFGEQLFMGVNMIFPLTTGNVTSYYRFMSVLPSFFIRLFGQLERYWIGFSLFCLLINICLLYVWVSLSSGESPVKWLTY